MAEKTIVSKSEFARMCGVTSAAIATAFAVGKKQARIKMSATKVDLESDWAKDYMARRNVKRGGQKNILPADTPPQSPPPPLDRGDLELRKLAGEVRKLELDNGKKERSLVDRVLVERMIASIDRALNMVIMDAMASLIPEIFQEVKAGAPVEEVQKFYHDKISRYIAPVKPELVRAMRNYDRDNG